MSEVAVALDGQYRAIREEAAWAERKAAILVAKGADAAEYLHSQLTNDVESLEPGQGCYAALLDRKAKMQSDMRVLRRATDELLVVLEPIGLAAVSRHLTMYSIGREVEFEDLSGDHLSISVAGPAAFAKLGIAPLSPENANRHDDFGGATALSVATDLGFDLLAGASSRDEVLRNLEAAGIEPVTQEAMEIARVEAGRPRFGRDMTTETIPQEAGINERAVSFTKGCYIGQETVARLHYRGKPNRHLRGLDLDGEVEDGALVTLGDRELGRIGTAVLSPSRGPIALAILRREAEPGDTVEVAPGVGAKVVELPFDGSALAAD